MKVKKWLGSAPEKCDLCGAKITETFIDGRTVMGPWAKMCNNCHTMFGVGLGTGFGQRYKKNGTDWIKTEG